MVVYRIVNILLFKELGEIYGFVDRLPHLLRKECCGSKLEVFSIGYHK